MKRTLLFLFLFFALGLPFLLLAQPNYVLSQMKMEKSGRGVIAFRKDASTVFVSWRYLSSDSMNIAFNVYRDGTKLNTTPVINKTCYADNFSAKTSCTYEVRSLINGTEMTTSVSGTYTLPLAAPTGYLNIPLDVPSGGTTPDNVSYTYSPNDASIGDVDGDGEYEIILKWDPSNSKDNSQDGCTGNVFIDCYKLNGTKLWRIDLGKNIRAGAHYTQFMVYDLDSDGKAGIVMKTADGTIDGQGVVIGDATADYRILSTQNGYTRYGRVLLGPEFLTVFNGATGAAMKTINYKPARGATTATEMNTMWGDNYGNRVDRFLACIAYLDGEHPSVVMCRGYYTRTVLVAYDWNNGELTERWTFDSNDAGNSSYVGQGNHNLRVGDVDGDGKDEIVYGSCTIDHDGKGLYSTGLGHGDAMHITVFDPEKGGLQAWASHENKTDGSTYRDAKTGEILFQIKSTDDVGRCMAADIDPRHKGVEMWSSRSGGIRNIKGEVINTSTSGVSMNMAAWWDGDLLRELQDGIGITKYNYSSGGSSVYLSAAGCASNNSTKANPCLVADIVGDWREDLLLRTEDNTSLRLYVSGYDTDYRFHTFLEDPVYRISVATQNVAYNQPTQPGFYFGPDLGKCFAQKDTISDSEKGLTMDAGMKYDNYQWMVDNKIIGNTRSVVITTNDLPLNTKKKVKLLVTFRGYQFTDSVNVTLTKTTVSVPANELADKISIYKTSSDNIFHIQLPETGDKIDFSIFDITGKMINNREVSQGTREVLFPASLLARGVYLVRIMFGDQLITKKIAIK